MSHNNNKLFILLHHLLLMLVITSGLISIIASGSGGLYGIDVDEISLGLPVWAPSIYNLDYSPTSTSVGSGGGAITVTGSIDFEDEDGNVSTLVIDIFDSGGNRVDQINDPIQGNSGQTSGMISFTVSLDTSVADNYTFEMYIIDTHNLHSNVLEEDFSVI